MNMSSTRTLLRAEEGSEGSDRLDTIGIANERRVVPVGQFSRAKGPILVTAPMVVLHFVRIRNSHFSKLN